MTKKNSCYCGFLEDLYQREGVPREVVCRHEHYCPTCKASCCSETGICAPLELVDLDPDEITWYCTVCMSEVRKMRLIATQPSQGESNEPESD